MIRTGIGYDVHRLVEGRLLVLGGVEIPHARGLEGHSDADVLCHAIADAVLGAVVSKPKPKKMISLWGFSLAIFRLSKGE